MKNALVNLAGYLALFVLNAILWVAIVAGVMWAGFKIADWIARL